MEKTRAAATHTPGPWTVEPSDVGDASVGLAATPPTVFVGVPNDDRFRTVTVAIVSATTYGNDEDGYPLTFGNVDANARLIAAAPDLLAACKGRLHADDCTCGACEPLQAAIAKAEGH